MKKSILICLCFAALSAPFPGVRAAQFRSYTDAVSGSYFFEQRINWVGDVPPDEGESQTLFEILDAWRSSNQQTGLADLEMFLAAYSNSAWAPSLHANLGKFYRDNGYYTLALEHWQAAWAATQDSSEGAGKLVGDYTLAHWTRLLASLGRYETLDAIFAQTQRRVLLGRFEQMWLRTKEAFVDMGRHPWHSYKCGISALYNVGAAMNLPFDARKLGEVGSPPGGISLKTLSDLSAQLNLGLVAVLRQNDSQLFVPSVIHLKQDHYAAIVARQGDLYKVMDPTFGHPQWLSADAINSEASDVFLVPTGKMPLGWRFLSATEQSVIYGRGNPNFQGDANNQTCTSCPCPAGSDGSTDQASSGQSHGQTSKFWQGKEIKPVTGLPGPGCRTCLLKESIEQRYLGIIQYTGMPVWRVDEPYINLWLTDEPLGYQPSRGPRVSFTLAFKQRDEFAGNAQFFNFADRWNSSWFSYVFSSAPLLSADVQLPNGGRPHFDLANGWATNYYNNFRLHALTNVSGVVTNYELLKPDGSKIVYGFFATDPGGNWFNVFMTQQVDPFGNALTFQYPGYDPDYGYVRLGYVIDVDNHTNTLNYLADYTSGDNRVGSVTNQFGQSVSLGYDPNYFSLTNITDSVGISTKIDQPDAHTINLITPYGTNNFTLNFPDPPYQDIEDRSIIITEPNGSRQIYALNYLFYQWFPWTIPSNLIPTNTPIGTLDTETTNRNSFYWGPQQCATLPADFFNFDTNDYFKARLRHWLGGADEPDMKPMDTLSFERDFSPDGTTMGQITFYDYANKGPHGNDDKGPQILPSVIARVVPDGSTWYQYYPRNGWGAPTSAIETYTKTDGSIGTRTNTFVYDGAGIDLLIVTNALGIRVSSNAFNAYHQVLTNYDALNQMTVYTYDGNHRLSSVQTPGGLLTTNLFSADGRLSASIDSSGSALRTNSYTWNADGTLRSQTDPRGLAVTNYWDNLQRLTGVLYPDNTTISNIYTYLDVTATKDRLGQWTYSGFNSVREMIAKTNVNSVVTRYGYCECGALMSITNGFGTAVQEVLSFNYDLQGNRTFIYHPDGTTVTNWFDSLRRVIATGDGIGVRWFGYNNQGLQSSVTNAVGVERRTIFDIADRVYSATDANGVSVTNTYDNLDRLLSRTYPDSGVEKFSYTARGLTNYVNPLSKTNWFVFDAAGRKTSETNANNEVSKYAYNAASDLLTLTDAKNQVTTWNYDQYGRVTNKLDQASVEILRYKYDADSRLTNRWSKAKGDTYYSYDNADNLTFINYPVSADITLQYDALNRLTNMVDAVGTTKYTYFQGGLLNSEDGPWASDTVTYTYNNRMRASLSLQQQAGSWTNGYTWDAAHRLGTETSPAGTFTYTYQSPGLLVKKLALPNTSYITNTYDNVARLTGTYLDNSSNTILDKSEYLYNAGNQRIRHMRADGSYYTNNYDNIGQLTWADSTVAAEDRGYLYDAAWNLNVRTNNGATSTFSVDSKNQLTTVPGGSCAYDNNGNLTSDPTRTFSYDDENELTQVIYPNSYRIDLAYDGRMRLRKRTEYSWNASTWVLTNDNRYVYDGMKVIQERDGANNPKVAYTRGADLSGTFEGAGGIGGLLARSDGYSSGSFGSHNYYHADGGGNISYMVNSSQSMVAAYRYDPYGNQISSSGMLASTNTYRFSSKEWLTNGNLYYYGYRFYDPNFQRWLNRDPIMETGGINLFGFVGNEPLTTTDKFGLEKDRDCVRWCHEQYEWDFGLSTGIGVGGGLGQLEHFGPKGRPRIPFRRGITEYGTGLCRVGYLAVLGFLADNVGEHGGISLEGCLSGCPNQLFWVEPHSPSSWPILGPDPLTPPNCKRNICW